MAEPLEATCACGCGERLPLEEMVPIKGGQHVTEKCLEAVILRGSMDDEHMIPADDDSPTTPMGDPGEAGHPMDDDDEEGRSDAA